MLRFRPRGPATPYRLVIFDFDGTLADSLPWLAGVFGEVAARHGFKPIGVEEHEALRGHDPREALRRLGIPAWKLPLIIRHLRRLAARDAGTIPLFDGVDRLLRRLADAGIARAIVSSNAEATIRRVLGPANAGLVGHYACGAGLLGKRPKLRAVLRRSGVAPGEAICVGDEVRDAEAAAREGIAFGAVTWGYATPAALAAFRPAATFESVAAIADRIARPRATGTITAGEVEGMTIHEATRPRGPA